MPGTKFDSYQICLSFGTEGVRRSRIITCGTQCRHFVPCVFKKRLDINKHYCTAHFGVWAGTPEYTPFISCHPKLSLVDLISNFPHGEVVCPSKQRNNKEYKYGVLKSRLVRCSILKSHLVVKYGSSLPARNCRCSPVAGNPTAMKKLHSAYQSMI
jgi:hypothetical protein